MRGHGKQDWKSSSSSSFNVSEKCSSKNLPLPDKQNLKRKLPLDDPIKPCPLKKWSQFNVPGKPCDLLRPSLSYSSLAILAVLNAPNFIVSCSDVYTFILHHFAYYRFASSHWQSNIRQVFCGTKKVPSVHFKKVGSRMAQFTVGVFTLKNIQAARAKARVELIVYCRNEAPERGEFLNRMINGTVGLPRQLFYQVIGLHHRNLAGPENSAMFYHLLAGKIVPKEARPLQYFIEYRDDHLGFEPRYFEKWMFYDLSKWKNLSVWGAGLGVEEEGLSMDTKECDLFHKNIKEYFVLQKSVRSKGFVDWDTPLHCYVFDKLIHPYLSN